MHAYCHRPELVLLALLAKDESDKHLLLYAWQDESNSTKPLFAIGKFLLDCNIVPWAFWMWFAFFMNQEAKCKST